MALGNKFPHIKLLVYEDVEWNYVVPQTLLNLSTAAG